MINQDINYTVYLCETHVAKNKYHDQDVIAVLLLTSC